jgi:hypothetical protein
MLVKLAPQKVIENAMGYIVQVEDRYHVEYLEHDKHAIIEVDFGPVVGIYPDTLTNWITSSGLFEITEDEKKLILSRVSEALRFMGCQTELC